jgi:hypothetical protein
MTQRQNRVHRLHANRKPEKLIKLNFNTMIRIFIVLLLIGSFSRLIAQKLTFAAKTSQSEIASRLFEGEWNVRTEECVWKPNLSESYQFGESYDGYLYTKIDTSFSYKNSFNTFIVLITSTYIKDQSNEYENCHGCAPSLSIIKLAYNEDQTELQLANFCKYVGISGSWGIHDDVSLFHIGGDDYFIKVDGFFTGQGSTEGYTTLYFEGKDVLTYSSYSTNGASGEEESNLYENTTSVFVDKELERVVLTKKGTERIFSGETSKVVQVNETITYEFKNGIFEKLCH